MKKFWYLVAFLFVLFSFLFILGDLLGYTNENWIESQLEQFSKENGVLTAGLVIVTLLSLDLFLPIPSSILMTVSGALLGTVLGSAVSFVGAMLSAITGYWLCHAWGRKAFRHWVGEPEAINAEKFMRVWGAWGILLSRPIPMLTEVVSCMAGLTKMDFRLFVSLSVAGTLPICILYAWAGSQLNQGWANAVWALAIAMGLPAAAFLWIRVSNKKK